MVLLLFFQIFKQILDNRNQDHNGEGEVHDRNSVGNRYILINLKYSNKEVKQVVNSRKLLEEGKEYEVEQGVFARLDRVELVLVGLAK